VVDAASCFTGWDFGGWHAPVYEFRFAHENHDDGAKSAFGLELPAGGGVQDGERLIEYLAGHPATARFLSWRIAQRFVADDPPATLVEKCAGTYLSSGGNVASVLRTLFASEEFWAAPIRRAKVKSPFEFATSAIRAAGGTVSNAKPLSKALSDMGMPLYECKPPTGYSNRSTDWVNVSSQLHRINFALSLGSNLFPGVAAVPPSGGAEAAVRKFNRDILGAENSVTSAKHAGEVRDPGKVMGLLMASPEFQAK
jgi:uncharacterized protein (DUF1800 family)